MKRDVHRVVLCIVDHDDVGKLGVADVIEHQRYPNHCITPKVMKIDTQQVDWPDDDAHPLNNTLTQTRAFAQLFDDGLENALLAALELCDSVDATGVGGRVVREMVEARIGRKLRRTL